MTTITPLPQTASPNAQLTVSVIQRSISCSIPIACTPATLYAVWADVAHWHTWDPDTRWAKLDGAFAVGSQGKIAPQKGMAVKLRISEATPDRSFTVVSPVLGNRMIFRHVLETVSDDVLATHHVQFTGWLAGLFMKTVGADVRKGLPLTMTRLKHLCEERERHKVSIQH
jgi:hypothetical protein